MKTDNQEIKSLINDITISAREMLGNRCMSVYLMGSLARGGFSEVASDIDMGIILSGTPQENDFSIIEEIQANVVANYPQIDNNVSIFWGTIESINGVTDVGRYPPFDRLDLIDHALLLSGIEVRDQLIRPTKEELEVASAEFSIDYLGSNERINEFLNCELITNKGAVYVTKTVLFPARFIYLAKTGEIAGNDVSYRYYIDNFSGSDAELVNSGYQWRLNSLPEDLDAVTKTISNGLIKLYHNFIDIYVEQMDSCGQIELKSNLIHWKQNITRPSI
ncbi:hypothetical protein L4C34_19120 [Vibrio profundum]|uniref:hypothetical protein n=1 Tax=Vibrio profundum TaxID=2910247 RepID=UPI003D0C3740